MHRSIVVQLTVEYAHSIEYRDLQEEGNCATFALGLTENDIYQSVKRGHARKINAGRGFIDWLIQHHLSELDNPVVGSLALYFLEGVWQHVGVVAAPGRIVSQWGTYPVYEHAVFELPTAYGENVRYFKKIDSLNALRLFREYAKATALSSD